MSAKKNKKKSLWSSRDFAITIGEICENCPTSTPDIAVDKIINTFELPDIRGIVLIEEEKPVGLIMKNKLYYQLGSFYGVSLYYRRPIASLMDKSPLIVDSGLPLEAVSQLAMQRKEDNLYDLIIVVKRKRLLGTVSIINLLKHVTNMQIRQAANANALTGLPGNLIIEEKLRQHVENNSCFSLLYIDIDNFKAFNDKYGFERGDKALLLTAEILNFALAELDEEHSFLGHIGGDDFVIITTPANTTVMCDKIITAFDKKIVALYDAEDQHAKGIIIENRQGTQEKYSLMTVSIGVINSTRHNFINHLEISAIAAELKKKAKTIPGSVWVEDSRRRT
ncbi:MAG: GGDEF domain-containing protein [Sporomusaceae bacterium]|nr:GGDEF domain-containing protein [Sporomusaceae bacterium]